VSQRLLAAFAVGALGFGLGLGGSTRYVWYRWGRGVHRRVIAVSFGLLVLALVLGLVSWTSVGVTAAALATLAVGRAGETYVKFRHRREGLRDHSVAPRGIA